MRWAMIERIRVMETNSSPAVTTGGGAGDAGFAAAGTGGAGAGVGVGAGAAATGAGAGALGLAPPFARKPRTSSLVIRPDEPVPGTLLRSRLFSRAILRTRGDERIRSPVPSSAVSASGSGVDVAGAAGWVVAGAPAVVPIVATTVLIWTVEPASTLISESTPAAGEGISASTLSVEISNRGSSCCTVSPGFFSHLVVGPSKIDFPLWGMITSVAETAAGCTGAAGAGELVALGGSTDLSGVLAAGASTAGGGAAAAGWPSASPMTP